MLVEANCCGQLAAGSAIPGIAGIAPKACLSLTGWHGHGQGKATPIVSSSQGIDAASVISGHLGLPSLKDQMPSGEGLQHMSRARL